MKKLIASLSVLLCITVTTALNADDNYYYKWVDICHAESGASGGPSPFIDHHFILPVLNTEPDGRKIYGKEVDWMIEFGAEYVTPGPGQAQTGISVNIDVVNTKGNPVGLIYPLVITPAPAYQIPHARGVEIVWFPDPNSPPPVGEQTFRVEKSKGLDLERIDWNQAGVVISYQVADGVVVDTGGAGGAGGPGGPGGPGGGGGGGGDPVITAKSPIGQLHYYKPGEDTVRAPFPAFMPPNNSADGGSGRCDLPPESSESVAGNSSIELVQQYMMPETVSDVFAAERPSICHSCGGGLGGDRSRRSSFSRFFKQQNLFWPTSTGRGSFSNLDYSLMFRNEGDAVAFMFDPVLGTVVKFHQRMEEVQTGGGTTTLVPTEWFDPGERNYYFESFRVLDDLNNPITNPIVECEAGKVFAYLTRRNGWKYTFRLAHRFDSRVEQISSPVGEVTSIRYKADYGGFTPEELKASPTRAKQIMDVTGPDGRVANFLYHQSKQAGRWAISNINFADGEQLEYVYGTDGFLTEVKRKRNANTNMVPISKYTYSSDTNNAVIKKEHWNGKFFVTKSLLVTTDYRLAALSAKDNIPDRTWEDDDEFGGLGDPNVAGALELVNQVGGELLGIENGLGQRELTVYRSADDTRMRLIKEGQLIEWAPGTSVKYSTVMPGDPSDFSEGTLEDTTVPGQMFAMHIGEPNQDLTPDQLYGNRPPSTRDMYGNILHHQYDANGNLEKTIYNQGETYESYEQWSYTADNHLSMYRDRGGQITKYERDGVGRVTAVIRGVVDDGNGGFTTDVNTKAVQTKYKYNNLGLLEWYGDIAYPGGEPAEDYRTSFVYNAEKRVTEVRKPAIQTAIGTLQRPVITYAWNGDELTSMTDEKGNQTTFLYDDYGRLIKTTYVADSTDEEVLYLGNNQVFRKSRGESVSLLERDNAGRVICSYSNYGKDNASILDGQIATVHPSQIHGKTSSLYYSGWRRSYGTTSSHDTRLNFDFRGRVVRTYTYPGPQRYIRNLATFFNNRPFKTEKTYSQFVDGVQNFHTTSSYNGYSAYGELVRTVSCRDSASYSNNQQVLNLVRPTSDDPTIQINDAIRDLSGNVIDLIGPGGTITRTEYDKAGRTLTTKRAFGTSVESVSQTEYDALGRTFASIAPGGIRQETLYDPAGNTVESKIVPTGSLSVQTTKYTYTIKGEPRQTIANDNSVTERFYSQCCGHTSGTRNALGNGTIVNRDLLGRTVHSVQVGNFDTQWNSPLNPATADTYSETTNRYGDDGRLQFTTKWTTDPGAVNVNNPPIAGLDSIPVSDGITTQHVYDDKLNDGLGLDATGGMTITRLHSGGVNTIDISPVLAKLAETEANGGVEAHPVNYDPFSASVVISPDEKSMRVSIRNASGTASILAVMYGPAATTPNVLVDWTCSRGGLKATGVPGHSWVGDQRTVYPDGTVAHSYSNGFGQSIGSRDQLGKLSRAIHNSRGELIKTIDAVGNETTYSYDDLGRRTTTTDALQNNTSVTYDSAGRVKTSTDAKGAVTTNHFDGLGRLVKVTDRLGQETLRNYDSMNRLSSIIDAESKATAYDYDVLGRRTKTTLADGSETTYDFDNAGRQFEITKPSGIKIKRIFTEYSGELDKTEYYNATGALVGTDDYSYDAFLRRVGSTSRDNVVLVKTYTELSQLATETTTYGSQPYVVNYDYDDRGRVTKVTYPSGRAVDYAYDNRGQLETVDWDGSTIETIGYDDLGRLASVDRPFVDEARTYDAAGRLIAVNNTNVGDVSYTYDANGNKQSESWTGVMAGWNFTTTNTGTFPSGYDDEDRFRNFVQSAKSVDLFLDRSNIGNITNYKLGTTDAFRSCSDTHELTTIDGTSQTFDVDGQLTDSHSGIELDWDEAGMLSSTVVSSGDTAGIEGTNEYGYDASQKRAWKKITRSGSVAEHTVFIYAGPNCIAEYDSGTAATSPNQEYVYGQGIDSLKMIVRSGGTQKLIVTRNQQWSISALADHSNGAVLERYTYDAFGKRTILAADGSTVRTFSSYDNPYGYTSRRHDDESGLMYFRARYYDTETGEFGSPDPLEYVDGMSQYRAYFVMMGVDPLGLKRIICRCYRNWYSVYDNPRVATNCIHDGATCCKQACANAGYYGFANEWRVVDASDQSRRDGDLIELFVDEYAKGTGATVDGFIPHADPFKNRYTNEDGSIADRYRMSRLAGAFSREVLLIALNKAAAKRLAGPEIWAKSSFFERSYFETFWFGHFVSSNLGPKLNVMYSVAGTLQLGLRGASMYDAYKETTDLIQYDHNDFLRDFWNCEPSPVEEVND